MKKILAGALAAALFCVPASLQVSAHPPVTVLVDGHALTFDQPPVIQDDRHASVRTIFGKVPTGVAEPFSRSIVTSFTSLPSGISPA